MKNILNTFIFCLVGFMLVGCTSDEIPVFGKIYGIVFDMNTNEPIRGAEVVLAPGNITSVTGQDGRYEFSDLEPKQYKLQIKAAGYYSNTRQINAVAGISTSCDMALKPKPVTNKLELSTTSLNFGSDYSKLSFSIRNVGNAGLLLWSISDVADWLVVSPTSGETEMGKSSAVTVKVNRSMITSERTTTFLVSAGDESIPVNVTAKPADDFTFSIAPNSLEFDSIKTIDILELCNVDYNGIVEWYIPKDYPEWISRIEPSSGNLRKGQKDMLIIEIDYSKITQNVTTSLAVHANEKVIPVLVSCHYEEKPVYAFAEISPSSSISFGKTKTQETVTLKAHISELNYTAKLENCSGSWVTLNKTSGVIPEFEIAQRTENIILTVHRDRMHSDNERCTLVVNAGNDVFNIDITAEREPSEGGSGGGDNPGGNIDKEDYSTASITSCDHRVKAEIVSCKRLGTSVTFSYTLTNNGLGNVNDWRIYPPSSMSIINGGTRSSIVDNEGNDYPYPNMTFRSASTTGVNVINTSFPDGVKSNGTVTIKGVPTTVKTLDVIIGVYAYPNSKYNMIDSKVTFNNIPIY